MNTLRIKNKKLGFTQHHFIGIDVGQELKKVKSMKLKSGAGFTLIELLVVIAIIGLLATIVMVSLNSARGKARDARRLADAHQFQLIMQLYYDSNGTFPNPGGNYYYTSASSGHSWQELETAVGQKLPVDPIGAAPGTGAAPYYEYYKSWAIGSAGSSNCYGRSILRIVPGMESRSQIRECDEQYAGQGSTFVIE